MYPPFLIVNEKLIIVEIQRAAFQKTKAILCVPTPEHRHEGVKLISLEVRHVKWNFE